MGLGTESAILTQAKKAQGETNQRLDTLIAGQTRIITLLEHLLQRTATHSEDLR